MQKSLRWVRSMAIALLTLGYCLLVGLTSCSSASTDQSSAEYPSSDVQAVEYFTQLGLLQGELRAVKELTEMGYLERLPDHLGVTIDQPYATLNQRVNWDSSYLISLFNLRDMMGVKAFARKDLILNQQQKVVDRLTGASIYPSVRRWQSVPLSLRSMEQQLLQFGQLYKAAVQNQVIVSQPKYESARGLIAFVKDNAFQPIKNELSRVNPVLAGRMESSLDRLVSAVPTTVLTGTSVSDIQAIDQAVADFVETSQRLIGVT